MSVVSAVEYARERRARTTCCPTSPSAATARCTAWRSSASGPSQELDGTTVLRTASSRTSVLLLELLCRHRWRVRPEVRHGARRGGATSTRSRGFPHEAVLVIGDAALAARRRGGRYPWGWTSARSGRQWTGLPFVFAVWAARRDAPTGAVRDGAPRTCSRRAPGGSSTSTCSPTRRAAATGVPRDGLPRLPRRPRLRLLVPAPRRADGFLPPPRAGRAGAGRARSAFITRGLGRMSHDDRPRRQRRNSGTTSTLYRPARRCSSWARWPTPSGGGSIPTRWSPTSSTATSTTPTSAWRTAGSAPSTAGRRHGEGYVLSFEEIGAQDRRVQGHRRRADPAAGRAQPVHPVRVVPRADALHQARTTRSTSTASRPSRGGVLQRALPDARARGDPRAARGRPRPHSRRRRRDPGGRGPRSGSRRRRRRPTSGSACRRRRTGRACGPRSR